MKSFAEYRELEVVVEGSTIPARGEVKPNPHLAVPEKKHSVIVTVSKDGTKERRRFNTTHNLGKEETSRRALAHYTNKGYKVHDFQHEMKEEVELDEDFTKMDTPTLKKWITTRERNAMGGNLSKKRGDQYDQAQVEMKKRKANEEVDQLEEMTQGKEYTQAQLQKKIQSGNWEATHDIKPGKHVEMRHHSGKRVTVQVKEEVDSTVEDLTEGTQSSIEKKIQAKRDSLSLAKEQRRAKGQHVQGQREIKLQAEIDRLNTELTQLKRQGMSEESELGDLAHQKTLKHRFLVTYSDPSHTSASMRKEKQQKHVLVPGSKDGVSVHEGEAKPLVKKYMNKQGYRVHDIEHVGMVSKKVNEETSYLPNRHIVSVVASKDGGEKQHIKVKVSATSKAEAKGIARLQLKKKGYETHSATHHGIDYSGFKKEEVDQLDELSKETLKSYVDKVSTGPSRGTTPTGTLKSIKAIGGVTKAIRKQYANSSVSEEHEHTPLKSFAAFASEVN